MLPMLAPGIVVGAWAVRPSGLGASCAVEKDKRKKDDPFHESLLVGVRAVVAVMPLVHAVIGVFAVPSTALHPMTT